MVPRVYNDDGNFERIRHPEVRGRSGEDVGGYIYLSGRTSGDLNSHRKPSANNQTHLPFSIYINEKSPKMSLLHRNTFHPASDLFRLLDEASSLSTVPTSSSSIRRTFSPCFDVHETENSYILEGEFPGLQNKDELHLEFMDQRTLLVRGRTERSHQFGQPPRVTDTEDGADGNKSKGGADGTKSKGWEDGTKDKETKPQQPRYWVSERSVGEFQRSFSFPTPVDVDSVKAELEHGLLKITVPKMEQKKGKRIMVT